MKHLFKKKEARRAWALSRELSFFSFLKQPPIMPFSLFNPGWRGRWQARGWGTWPSHECLPRSGKSCGCFEATWAHLCVHHRHKGTRWIEKYITTKTSADFCIPLYSSQNIFNVNWLSRIRCLTILHPNSIFEDTSHSNTSFSLLHSFTGHWVLEVRFNLQSRCFRGKACHRVHDGRVHQRGRGVALMWCETWQNKSGCKGIYLPTRTKKRTTTEAN